MKLLLMIFLIVMVFSDNQNFFLEKCGEVTVPYFLCNNGTLCTDGCQLFDARGRIPKSSQNITGNSNLEVSPITPSIINKPISCGNRNQSVNVEDGKAEFGEFPWMVAVLEEEIEEGIFVYVCGASLIHPQVVLTSAQCVVNQQKPLKIRAGEWDVQTKSEVWEHQDRRVKHIITHPNFSMSGFKNDVALLILDNPLELTLNVGTVCLPSQDEVLEDLRCFGTGWGKNSFGNQGRYQTILKKVEVPIIQHDTCQRQLRTTRLGNYFILDNSFICAGGELGIDMCTGDGGGPLVCPISGKKDKYHQRGLISWGIGCGQELPAAYGNVADFRNWIDNEMLKLQFDTSTYTA